jgi:hypothetical protein
LVVIFSLFFFFFGASVDLAAAWMHPQNLLQSPSAHHQTWELEELKVVQ